MDHTNSGCEGGMERHSQKPPNTHSSADTCDSGTHDAGDRASKCTSPQPTQPYAKSLPPPAEAVPAAQPSLFVEHPGIRPQTVGVLGIGPAPTCPVHQHKRTGSRRGGGQSLWMLPSPASLTSSAEAETGLGTDGHAPLSKGTHHPTALTEKPGRGLPPASLFGYLLKGPKPGLGQAGACLAGHVLLSAEGQEQVFSACWTGLDRAGQGREKQRA